MHPPHSQTKNKQLLIKGVRSFAPDNQNVIEFYRPLTLIVGSNGAGKTVRREGGVFARQRMQQLV
jgi:DNA repair protein RAD50